MLVGLLATFQKQTHIRHQEHTTDKVEFLFFVGIIAFVAHYNLFLQLDQAFTGVNGLAEFF